MIHNEILCKCVFMAALVFHCVFHNLFNQYMLLGHLSSFQSFAIKNKLYAYDDLHTAGSLLRWSPRRELVSQSFSSCVALLDFAIAIFVFIIVAPICIASSLGLHESSQPQKWQMLSNFSIFANL